MFSSMIQNLLSTSGQSQAAQRYVELNRYVDNFNQQVKAQTPIAASPLQNSPLEGVQQYTGPSFDNVLKTSAKTP